MSLRDLSVEVQNDGLKEIAGEDTTYRRETEAIENVVGVPTRVRHTDYGENTAAITSRDKDWIYWQNDLVKAGVPWVPQRNDQIDWIDAAGVKRTYTVLPRGDEQRVFRFTDPSEQQLRIFTVETKASN